MPITLSITISALFGGTAENYPTNLDINLRTLRATVIAAGASKVACVVPPAAHQLGTRIQTETNSPYDTKEAIDLGLEHLRRRLRYAHKLEIIPCENVSSVPPLPVGGISIPVVVSTLPLEKAQARRFQGKLVQALAISTHSSGYLFVCSAEEALPREMEKRRVWAVRSGIPTILDGRPRDLRVAFCGLADVPALLDQPPARWPEDILL